MSITKSTFKSSPSKPNIIAKNLELIFFILITIFLTDTLSNEHNRTEILIKSTLLGVVLIFEIWFIFRLFKEPTFLSISNGDFILRPSFFIFKRKIHSEEIIGYSFIVRPYFVNKGRTKFKYSAYLLYLKNGRKILLTEYYFLNFHQFSNAFRKNGLKFLGKEISEWSFMKRKFNYDHTNS
jgi:hypothetical protein